MKKIAILGGGASALMCACFACKNSKVVIYEKNDKIGKKILATGNGRCNLTNVNMGSFAYNNNIDNFLNRFSVGQTIEFFNSLGLETYADEEGRVYPLSNSAVSVLEVLKNYLEMQTNVEFKTGCEVVAIKQNDSNYKIEFASGAQENFESVVVALGNYANLNMFEQFGITAKQFKPCLSALKCKVDRVLAGVRVGGVKVCCKFEDGEFCETGEVLFRQDGVSGIVVFNLSSFLARRGICKQTISIDLLPHMSYDKLKRNLLNRKNKLQAYQAEEFLTGFFHRSLNHVLLKSAQIKTDSKVSDISYAQIEALCSIIKRFELNIEGFLDNNQVCHGGVNIKDLTANLESKKHKGLYFIGEVVNVDGVCGGYNLQWAWTSGQIVGKLL